MILLTYYSCYDIIYAIGDDFMTTLDTLFGKCPFATAQKVLSGKWALMIMHHLNESPRRFNELQRLLPEITQTTLTRQLRTLEDYELIHREVYAQIPPKVVYSLSPIGQDFSEVLTHLETWGNKYIDQVISPTPQ